MAFIQLIRHAKTSGNEQKKYIGVTDEPLSKNGKAELALLKQCGVYSPVDVIFTSPMRRCKETAALIFENKPCEIVHEFAECDFGEFEGKSYEELKENVAYRKWIASNGRSGIPQGEDSENFRERNCKGFEYVMAKIIAGEYHSAAAVLHGGSIMAIMAKYAASGADFYEWQVKNCGGVKIELDESIWRQSHKIDNVEKIILPDITKSY